MTQQDEEFENQLYKATKRLVNVIIKQLEEQNFNPTMPIEKIHEKVMNAKEVCDYYGFSIATLRRHEQNGLKRMNESLKNKNRMFKLTTCEKYFNQKKN